MALGSGKDYGMTTKGRWANQLLEKWLIDDTVASKYPII
jgi:hypothetical protein